jgi:site-specific recombinase XerD
VESFIADQLARWKPATASNRYRSLQQFFRWLVEEGEITRSPMERMHPPHVPEMPPSVLTESKLQALLKACGGTDFAARRDTAIICLMIDTGMRRAELIGLAVADVYLDITTAVVLGKGRRPRNCRFGRKTALALDRYLRRARLTSARCAARVMAWAGRADDR